MVQFQTRHKTRKFRSIKEAAQFFGIPYMTFYMRQRSGWSGTEAANPKVRKYTRRNVATVTESDSN